MRMPPTLFTATAALAVLGLAGGAYAQTTVRPGTSLIGQLTSSDAVLPSGTVYDCYVVPQVPGRSVVTFDVASQDLGLWMSAGRGNACAPSSNQVNFSDDDETAARLPYFARSSGPVHLMVGAQGGRTGSYTLTVYAFAEPGPPYPEYPMLDEMRSRRWSTPDGQTPQTYLTRIRCSAVYALETTPSLASAAFAQVKAHVVGNRILWEDFPVNAGGDGYSAEDVQNQVSEMIHSLARQSIAIGELGRQWCYN